MRMRAAARVRRRGKPANLPGNPIRPSPRCLPVIVLFLTDKFIMAMNIKPLVGSIRVQPRKNGLRRKQSSDKPASACRFTLFSALSATDLCDPTPGAAGGPRNQRLGVRLGHFDAAIRTRTARLPF